MVRHWFKHHGECISRLPDVEGDRPKRQRFKRSPIGFFHIDIAEVQTAEGKLFLFVAMTGPASSPSPGLWRRPTGARPGSFRTTS